ncbi:MFS transporter [Burkholderia multivorans]|uniref:MFS transporter n=1 Tax=Burkholderia multivorans TaxID=87883 RepID=UPI001C24EAE1|nr:MFS transporter [Burkholderia multivorans]MBU9371544.1 MFS transporter [Burkholderia multivorans]MCA8486693.1 MFS transporter [Burkholderia multivorans]
MQTDSWSLDEQHVASSSETDALFRKVTWRLIPFLVLCYAVSFVERINVGYAHLQMQGAIGLSDAAFGLGAGAFFIGYSLFEVPSNMLLYRLGARKTISRIMFFWGLASAATFLVKTPAQFIALRALLGACEAGLIPGVMLYFTYWFTSDRRARVSAMLFSATAIAGIFVGPLSTNIMIYMDGLYGLGGWQFMFLLEGLPASVLGIVAYFYLTDRPAQARWLSEAEKTLLVNALNADDSHYVDRPRAFKEAFSDLRVYVLLFVNFSVLCANYAVIFWMPVILKKGGASSLLHIGWYSVIPYAAAAVAMVAFGRHSDAYRERRWHIVFIMGLAAAGLAILSMHNVNFALSVVAVTLVEVGTMSVFPILWAMPSQYLSGAALAAGLAFINTMGSFGGLVSPWFMGVVNSSRGSLSIAFYCLIGLLFLAAVVLLAGVPGRSPAGHEKHVDRSTRQ